MLTLTTLADVGGALADTNLDVDLRALLGLRAWQLYVLRGLSGGDHLSLFVVQAGDTAEVINTALGFDITGDRAEPPSYTWMEDHGLWFEIFYGGHGGLVTRVFVENGPATELGIHLMCLSHFWTEADGEAS